MHLRCMLLGVVALMIACVAQCTQIHLNPSMLELFLGDDAHLLSSEKFDFPALRRSALKRAHKHVTDYAAKNDVVLGANAEPNPYFHWIPPYVASVIPDGPSVQIQAPCFNSTTIRAVSTSTPGVYTIVFDLQQGNLFCSDFYLIATTESLSLQNWGIDGSYNITWNTVGASPAALWDLHNNGIRIFRFVDNEIQTVVNLFDTLLLLAPEFSQGISADGIARNLDFMERYAGHKMTSRPTPVVPVDASLISSGDFFGVIRLDGLDPMLAWAMGSTTGHTTVALRINGTLYICESTTKDSYWPTNGIQKTEYYTWMKQAQLANYSVVWAPLTPEARASFDEAAAVAFFETVEGFDYGFYNLLFGWIDTKVDNYPCLPPHYTQCLQWEHVPILAGAMEKLAPQVADMLFLQAFNHRVGTKGLKMADILYQYQAVMKQDSRTLPTIAEKDEWVYNTTRNGVVTQGPSFVCCVFVCNIWKASGMLSKSTDGNDFNCAELTNADDYMLNILQSNPSRPAACQVADPDNVLCQVEGQYTLSLNDFSIKAPYPHMAETCPSLCPNYTKPLNC